ncbi:MAG TPA: hypothetical protein VM577_02485 [Anaerovoracaceae bacterium]|nr:hypothetical protein [Anaerovoracaceae bacterium]
MDFDELLELLEIDSTDEFSDFEHFAALVECDEEIPYDLFYRILADVEPDTLVGLTDDYFEDVLQGIPDDGIDIYTLLGTIRQALLGLAKNFNTHEERIAYVDELFKFRNWFIFDSVVHIKRISDNSKKDVSACEALSLYRLEKLSEDQYRYDFSDCMDYEIDEYSISIDAALDEEYEEIIEEDENLYEEGLIDKEFPVIDGETFEEDEEEEY